MKDGRATRVAVLSVPIDILSWDEALGRIFEWSANRESRFVAICNVHSLITAEFDESFREVLRSSDMATPDGGPVAYMVRKLAGIDQPRINGPDLMWRHSERAAECGTPVFLYGGSPSTLDRLEKKLVAAFPTLNLAGSYSPPYRSLTEAEDQEVVNLINGSGAAVVWVALGCPAQERWIAAHRDRIRSVLIGVGAAFDYHAGTIKRAPVWMQRHSLEWLYRLAAEPRRLWRRYLTTNSLFLLCAARQLLRSAWRGRASEGWK